MIWDMIRGHDETCNGGIVPSMSSSFGGSAECSDGRGNMGEFLILFWLIYEDVDWSKWDNKIFKGLQLAVHFPWATVYFSIEQIYQSSVKLL